MGFIYILSFRIIGYILQHICLWWWVQSYFRNMLNTLIISLLRSEGEGKREGKKRRNENKLLLQTLWALKTIGWAKMGKNTYYLWIIIFIYCWFLRLISIFGLLLKGFILWLICQTSRALTWSLCAVRMSLIKPVVWFWLHFSQLFLSDGWLNPFISGSSNLWLGLKKIPIACRRRWVYIWKLI